MLKIKSFILPFILIAAACNQSTPASEASKEAQQKTPEAVNQIVSEAYFTGGESGEWSLEVLSSTDGTFPIKLTDDKTGEIFQGNLQKMGLASDGKPNVSSGEVKLAGNLLSTALVESTIISMVSDGCADHKGKKHSHTVTVTMANKKWMGCGDYSE